MALLKVRSLKVHYPIKNDIFGRTTDLIKAVNGVSLTIEPKETVGIVGESASGKSTLGKAIMGITKITSGIILFEGKDISKTIKKRRSLYRKNVQMIFQDAHTSFNPRKKTSDIIAEPLRNFKKQTKAEEQKQIDELLSLTGLSGEYASKYPAELSDEQKLRIAIARSIALKPKLLIMDEPVFGFDLTEQAQILNCLKDVQTALGFSCIFISRDLSTAHFMCERLAILHNARFVEIGTKNDIFDNPTHIYTKQLIAAMPYINPSIRDQTIARRTAVAAEYESQRNNYYKNETEIYNLKPLSETHYAALPSV